jgi:hypothetical protein
LPGDGAWKLKLEWVDPENLLQDKRRVQVDTMAIGSRALMLFEGKGWIARVDEVCAWTGVADKHAGGGGIDGAADGRGDIDTAWLTI